MRGRVLLFFLAPRTFFLLGMTKVEIDRQFEEIVEFSGGKKFFVTPFKRYSAKTHKESSSVVGATGRPTSGQVKFITEERTGIPIPPGESR